MSDVTGFFIEGGLFLTCPHCKYSNRVNVQSIFIPQHRGNPIECAKCKKEFHIKIELVPVVEAVEQQRAADASAGGAEQALADLWHHLLPDEY